MSLREDLVAAAVRFLRDPSVAPSSLDHRVAFLQSKRLTQAEIDEAVARAGENRPAADGEALPPQFRAPPVRHGPYAPPPWRTGHAEAHRRDWRDWFIMATVVGGVGYGLYELTKRYVYPLIAPPTPERLQQDKKDLDAQFERAFALVEQLAKDTEELKAAEKARTERLDAALGELDAIMADLKTANRQRESDAQRVRQDVDGLRESLPKALDEQRDRIDARMREVNTELKSLRTLVAQRLNPSAAAAVASPVHTFASAGGSNMTAGALRRSSTSGNMSPVIPPSTPNNNNPDAADKDKDVSAADDQPLVDYYSTLASRNRPSAFMNSPGKASIPAWQLAMANKPDTPTTQETTAEATAASDGEGGGGT